MSRNKYTRILVSSFLILMALWVATPKVYIHNLLHHNHTEAVGGQGTNVKSASTEDCDFEKYNKPVYFSIFKFIFSFIPVKSNSQSKIAEQGDKLSGLSFAISLLRAPPVAE